MQKWVKALGVVLGIVCVLILLHWWYGPIVSFHASEVNGRRDNTPPSHPRKPTLPTGFADTRPNSKIPTYDPLDSKTNQEYATDINAGLWGGVPVDPNNPRLTFSLLSQDAKLSSQAIKYANLDAAQIKPVQTIIDNTFTEMTLLTRKHAESDPLRTDPENGVFAFRIRPFPEEGRQARESLKQKLAAEVGSDSGSRLMECFLWTKYFGAFGEGEVLVTFKEESTGSPSMMTVEWQLRHPETGRVVRSGSGPYESWNENFGDVFQFE